MLFNETSLFQFVHTMSAAFLVAGTVVAAISIWWMARSIRITGDEKEARGYWKPVAKIGLTSMLISSIVVIGSGHFMGQHPVISSQLRLQR